MDLRAAMNTKGDTSDMAIVKPTEQLRTSPPECSVSRAMATGAARCVLSELEKLFKLNS